MHASAKTLLVPILGGAALVGSYFAGQYVGAHDERKVQEKAFQIVAADASAEKLRFANEAMRLIGESKVADANRMLGRYADLQIDQVSACLNDAGCAVGLGGEDRVTHLRALVVMHAKSRS